MGLDILSGISAGSGLIGGIVDAITANSRMKEAEGFSDQQALQQRKWAVEDRDWQANYNSPVNIMARYKAAGLNPNLIYGNNGFQAPAVRSTPAAQPYVAQPSIGKAIGNTLSDYQDARQKNQAFENAQLVAENLKVDNLSKQADVVKKNMQNIILTFNPLVQASSDSTDRQYHMDQEEQKYQTNIFYLSAHADAEEQRAKDIGIKAAVDSALQNNNIQIGFQQGIQAVINSGIAADKKKLLEQLLQSGELSIQLKQMQIDMQNGGLNANSPFYQKILSGFIDAALMYAGGKMSGIIPSHMPTQRPQFQPGITPSVPQPGGNYRPPNSGMPNSALYNRSDLYNR